MGKPTLRTWAMLIATCISAPGSVLAQWTTNGTNIYNTNTGNVGICISSPVSKLEILQSGGGSGQNVGLKIWAGNTNTYFGNSQIQFSYGGGGYLHAIKSRHSSATLAGNSFDFFLWQPGDPINSEGSLNGNVGIGTFTPNQKLTVNGTVYGKEVKVDLNVPAPDYVFENDYSLTSLEDLQYYIEEFKHLPEVPSAVQMEKEGIDMARMNMMLLKKVEELTLYVINQDKEIKALKKEFDCRNSTIQSVKN